MAKNVKVTVPHSSTHPLNTRRQGTGTCGTLIPVLCTELMAGSKFRLSAAVKAELAPLATDAFMNCDLKFEAFAVPHRVLCAAFPKWLTGEKIRQLNNGSISETYASMPVIRLKKPSSATGTPFSSFMQPIFKAASLPDYLGFRFRKSEFTALDNSPVSREFRFSPLPFLAYHRVWSDWYRNQKVQLDCFTDSHNTFASGYMFAGNLGGSIETTASTPYQVTLFDTDLASNWTDSFKMADGVSLFDLRQRNFGYDYFTNATLNAQLGTAQSVSTSGASFTISSLRAANSIQLWLERSQLGSYKWQDWLHAHYGTNLSSGIAQRSIYLGHYSMPVYTKGVDSTAVSGQSNNATNSQYWNHNPFYGYPAVKYGQGFISSDGSLVDEVAFDEPVYLLVMMSLVPKVTYSSGISRYLQRYTENGSVTDMADPLLQNVGNQPIYLNELIAGVGTRGSTPGNTVFGYTDRYADWMNEPDLLCGLLRDEESLAPFALQRSIAMQPNTGIPTLTSQSSAFLEIPKDYLRQVLVFNTDAVQSAAEDALPIYNASTGFDFWYDVLFDLPVSHPLHEYSIPSLQDPAAEHGRTISIDTFSQL